MGKNKYVSATINIKGELFMKKLFASLVFCCLMLVIFPTVSNADEVVKTVNFGEVSVEAIVDSDLSIDFDVDITEIPTITPKIS